MQLLTIYLKVTTKVLMSYLLQFVFYFVGLLYWYDYGYEKKVLTGMVSNVNKTNNHLSPQIIEHKKTHDISYGIGNPGPGLGETQRCGRVEWDPNTPSLGSTTAIQI
jgi:hypothetical protein